MRSLRRKNPAPPSGPRQDRAKVTDWIQALTVVIGVAIAVWQLVIVDRDSERQKRRAVSDLILAAQGDQFLQSTQAMLAWAGTTAEPDTDLLARLLPIELHYQAWTFCIAHDLCDRELALTYVCRPFGDWNKLVAKQNLGMEGFLFPRGSDFNLVVDLCKTRHAEALVSSPSR